MEFVSVRIKLRDLFLDNGNWWRFFLTHRNLIRKATIEYRLLDQFHRSARTLYRTWRDLLKASFGLDPLTCPVCSTQLVFAQLVRSPPQHVLVSFHQQIAQGYFKRL